MSEDGGAHTHKYVSRPMPLPAARWPEVVEAAVDSLKRCGVTAVETMFGVSTTFSELEWVPQPTSVPHLNAHFARWQAQGLRLGAEDVFVMGEAPWPFTLRFCHEGDLHVETAQRALVDDLRERLGALGVSLIAAEGAE